METIQVNKTFSRGFALAPAFVVQNSKVSVATYTVTGEESIQREQARFNMAVDQVSTNLEELAAANEIFAAHLSLVNDFMLRDGVFGRIQDSQQNAEAALQDTITEIRAIFEQMEDEYMRERAADISDVGNRLLASLQGRSINRFDGMNKPSVIIAEDLAPSDTANLSLDLVKGFITEKGGITSHVSIMARSLGIPALVGVSGILAAVKPDMIIAMNAQSGQIILDPDEETQAVFAEKQKAFEIRMKQLEESSILPAVTTDGHKVKVFANVGSVQDIRNALPYHVNGIGLFRSEFLFMENTHFPTEEEQFATYKDAILTLGHETIVRTLDIGGDKGLSYFEFPAEENPFLGYRAIRLCLDRTDVFKTQIRALLRASQFGPLRIMIPMIISVEELEAAKDLIQACKDELTSEGVAFNADIPVGIMIETPAAVIMAPDLASRCDFFSIGTNDLTQYVLAVDRGNQRISHLYDSCNPAVLRAVKQVIDAGHAAGIEVGMCGEFASDLAVTELLLGLGLDEFSMAAGETPIVKEKIRTLNFSEAQKKTHKVISAATTKDVHAILEATMA